MPRFKVWLSQFTVLIIEAKDINDAEESAIQAFKDRSVPIEHSTPTLAYIDEIEETESCKPSI